MINELFETNSPVLQDDYVKTANYLFDGGIIDLIKNKVFLITGGTGLIGTQITKTLLCCNRLFGSNIKVIVLSKDKESVLSKYNPYCLSKISVYVHDIREQIDIKEKVDYICHCASPTASKFFVDYPVETIDIGINGTMNVLNFAKMQDIRGFLFFSSLEVYGDINNSEKYTNEKDIGPIDFLNVRSSYSEGKRLCECICQSYLREYGVPVFIARFTQVIGADIDYNDNRLVAQFARSAFEGKDIVLKTRGNTIRNYCDISDAVSAVLYILTKGTVGEVYNVASKNSTISVYDFAQSICSKYKEKNISVIFDIDNNQINTGYNNEIKIKLGTQKLEDLGWSSNSTLEEAFEKVVKHFEEREIF